MPLYKVVLIHWPEQLFDWKEPSFEELENLKQQIVQWKQHATLCYVVHNEKRHKGMTDNYKILYSLIQEQCDVMIHLGVYSKNIFFKKFPNHRHEVLRHPLYTRSFSVLEKKDARQQLGLSDRSLIVIAPGTIRTEDERNFIINAFNNLNVDDKVFLVPRMLSKKKILISKKRAILRPLETLKRFFTSIQEKKYIAPKYHFNFSFMSNDVLGKWMSASDIVLIPRKSILNSGNVFLGLTFKKMIVGPKTGNVTEVLQQFDFPLFEITNDSDVCRAINSAAESLSKFELRIDDNSLRLYDSKRIALEYDALFRELISS